MGALYQMTLPLLTVEDTVGSAHRILSRAREQFGVAPNLYAAMAHAPCTLETYVDGYQRFRAASGFAPAEQEVVFLVISRWNGCEYCVAAHSMVADTMSGVPTAVTDAIREDHSVPDDRLAALTGFVRHLLESRGRPTTDAVSAFLAAGYVERQILEVILAIAVKTMSNYTNHMFQTPLDAMFAGRAWTTPGHPREVSEPSVAPREDA